MEKLRWGATSLVPEGARAAWGARAIIDGYGYGRSLSTLPDRRDLVLSEPSLREPFIKLLQAHNPVLLAEAKLVAGEVDPDVPVTIYEDAELVVVGRAAGGYFYLAAYLRPEGEIVLPRKSDGPPGVAAAGPIWLKLIRSVIAAEGAQDGSADGRHPRIFKLLDVGPGEDGDYRESYEGADVVFPKAAENIVKVVPKSEYAEAVIREALAGLGS